MENITFKCPTEILFMDDSLDHIGEVLAEHKYRKIVFLFGTSSLKKSGRYDKIINSLKKNNIEHLDLGGITPNPEVSFVRKHIKEVKVYKPDCILAVGGGSVLDTAKAFANSYYYDGDPLDFNKKIIKPLQSLPLVTVITISAAGSEMSDSSVLSEYETNFKSGFNDIHNRPTLSIEDPSLTLEVSEFQTCCGLVDIISHSFERYFSPSSKFEPCDYLALGIIKNIVDITPILLQNPSNYEARRAMMISSTLSHNGITSFGKNMRFICHQAEHKLSGRHPQIAHGLGLRFLLDKFLEVNKEALSDKIVNFGKTVFGVASSNPDYSISAFSDYLASLPISKSMSELGISQEEENEYISMLKI